MEELNNQKEKYYLSGCLIAKNEASYLLEWISFHKAVGFDYFYIYNNDSTDHSDRILSKLQEENICKYVNWPRSYFPDNPQVNAYRHAIDNFGMETHWLAIMDADEFLVPLTSDGADIILRENFSHASSVLCNWRIFGSSGLKEDDGRFCTERFKHRSVDAYHANNHVKAIVRPGKVEMAFVHNHYMKAGPILLSDGSTMIPERAQQTHSPVYGHFQVNHYYCKSLSEFMLKRAKGLAEYPLDHPSAIRSMEMFGDADRNEVLDERALDFADQTRFIYDKLCRICA